ncbi:MAG: tetratricopeptide repeat protein [Ignavibacteriaceae bacterium]
MYPVVAFSDKYQDAVRLFYEGNIREAHDLLLELLDANNSDYDVLNFLGIIKLNEEKYAEASVFLEKVVSICNYHHEAYYNLGLCYQRLENYDKAQLNYRKVLEFNGSHFDAINNLGVIHLSRKEYQQAESCLRFCISLDPYNGAVHNNLGNINLAIGKTAEGLSCYKMAVELEPRNAVFIYNLGIAFMKLNNDTEAINCFETAASINPDYDEVYSSLATLYTRQSDFNKAEKYLNRIKNDDNFSKALLYTNKGVAKLLQGSINGALALFDEALIYEPENPEIHYNKGHALLLSGNFEEGWKEYDWRLKKEEFKDTKILKPLPENIDLAGKRILIKDEQGLGDSIQFVRFISLLKQKGAYTIFECSGRLLPLYKHIKEIDELYPRDQVNPDIVFDYDIQLLSLPGYFKTTIKNIPGGVPYIKIEKDYKEKWEKLIPESSSYKIGIVWAGNANNNADRRRSCKLINFSPLFDVEGVEFYTLQKGTPINQTKDFLYPLNILDEYDKSFLDTAAIISQLDLVITVDTSIAHLAGAMGKDTWILLPFLPDWRWMLNRPDSPWYPHARLFRQLKPDDWESVFLQVKTALEAVKNKRNGISLQCGQVEYRGFSQYVNESHNEKTGQMIYLGLSQGENFGWGICSKYIKKELSKITKVIDLYEKGEPLKDGKVHGKALHALTNMKFDPVFNTRADINIGYTFFDKELNDSSIKNSANFNLILAGSSWCNEKLKQKGINNTDILIQGIDPEIFYPENVKKSENLFTIFSGGKFEYRKGQDLVLKAIGILQQKYNNIILVNAWYNNMSHSIQTMSNSKHIHFEFKGNTWEEFMHNLYAINNLDPKRIITLPLIPHNKLRELYLKSDIGLFPNRCEGGTNLMLMEYMACGRPAAASFNSGHMDILTDDNSFLLKEQNEVRLFSESGRLEADWKEPVIEEIVEKIEAAYYNRNTVEIKGYRAGKDMLNFTWSKTAANLLNFLK